MKGTIAYFLKLFFENEGIFFEKHLFIP